jgi:hypothetical protein
MDLKWAEDMEKQREMDELRVRYDAIVILGMMEWLRSSWYMKSLSFKSKQCD